MATASDHARVVLSAIIPKRRDLLEKAARQLRPDHFPEKVQANLFAMLSRYADYTSGAVMPLHYLDDQLRGKADAAQVALYVETYQLLEESEVDDSDFAWSVQQLREIAADKATGEILTSGMEILRNGIIEKGETKRGHDDARAFILSGFQDIDLNLNLQDAPEGDMREEMSQMLSDYAETKRKRDQGLGDGIFFGIEELDRKVGGMQPGDLVMSVGYSSDGKTALCVNTAWNAAVMQGKNVVFITTETNRRQIMRRLLARHSKHPIFGLPDGLNSKDLKAGTLTPELEEKQIEIAKDLETNPAYGKLFIAQAWRHMTLTEIEQKLYRKNREFKIDLAIVDSLNLTAPIRKRNSPREELQETMKSAKILATTFDDSRGIVLMSPWQVNREGRSTAVKNGRYTSDALSETSEATNSADLIVGLLAPEDNTNRYTEIMMQIMKHRDGETVNDVRVDVDYATNWFQSKGFGFGPLTSDSGGDGFSLLLPDE